MDTVVIADWKGTGSTNIVGYSPTVALYIAWVLLPLLALGALVALPFIVRYVVKRLPEWRAAIKNRGGSPMTTVSAAFCSQCGRPLNGNPVCECGFQAAPPQAAAATTPSAPPIGLWANLAWQRLHQVLTLNAGSTEMPLQASALSILLRALIIAGACHIWVNSLMQGLLGQLGKGTFLFGEAPSADTSLSLFGWLLLGLLLAAAVVAGLQYIWFGSGLFPKALAVLSDAQWPVALGFLLAWLLTGISPALGAGVAVMSVIWGQAVLANGLAALPLTYRKRVGAQMLIGLITVLAVSVVLNATIQKAVQKLMTQSLF